ncbi:sigma-54-dependent transcriptional regulator [Bordetella petrii]|uniref:Sigma-54 dependent transcriptional regulator n=1 Tax=Bordetella petrii TaxID=94624 RepID=A0ABT7VYX1_9BORD|nr:sigma-54 dependent transcriptional regulator [Bordetella petrii]MDM9558139.1 sigma-54 dependent transcriptional regulator [Bordetella petrii]
MSYTDVLIIEDDAVLGGALRQRLHLEGISVQWVQNCAQAIELMRRTRLRAAFVLADIRLPDGSGEDLYRQVAPYLDRTTVVFATAYGDIAQAVRLVGTGAADYLTKPYDTDALVARIRRAVEKFDAAQVADAAPENPYAVGMATLPTAQELQRLAESDLNVLLEGETGVGKDRAARYMHARSAYAAGPFTTVNCATLADGLAEAQLFGYTRGAFSGAHAAHDGLFAQAAGGTLYLDEVGLLSGKAQALLLRVLEDGHYRPLGSPAPTAAHCRIVASTNSLLSAAVERGDFRADLYYRLAVGRLTLPALRERRDDIVPLARRFLAEQPRPLTLTADAERALVNYDWPGNIRELKNRIARAAVMAGAAQLAHHDLFPEAPPAGAGTPDLAALRADAEWRAIQQAIADADGQLGLAAKRLGISRTTLWKRMRARKLS